MKELYYLNKNELPTLPYIHDCVIKEIELNDDYLIFKFEDDISDYDSILNKNYKSLIIKYHLIENLFVYKSKRLFNKEYYYLLKDNKINKLKDLDYLYQYVDFYSLIIKIVRGRDYYIFDLDVDYIEYEWIEGD